MVGISFKISKVGKKYLPKLQQEPNSDGEYTGLGKVCFECKRSQSGSRQQPSLICECKSNTSLLHSSIKGEACLQKKEGKSPCSLERKCGQATLVKMTEDISGCLSQNRILEISEDEDTSFAVNLFANGFSIGKPTEKGKSPPMALDVMDLIYPYNRTSEGFLMALNGGWLPGDILDEMPCRYINGCAICEVRDYRNSIPPGFNDAGPDSLLKLCEEWFPIVHRILLRPSTQTIVKGIASIVDDTCSFNNLMEVESRVLKTVHPELNLDPKADICQKNETSGYNIIKSSISQNGRLMDRRMRAIAVRAMVTASSIVNNKKISFEKGSNSFMSQSETETTLTCDGPLFSLEDKMDLSSSSKFVLKSLQDMKRAGISTRPRHGACIRVIQSPSSLNPLTQLTQSPVSAISGDFSIPSRLGADAMFNMPPLHGEKDDAEISTQGKFDEDAMQCDSSNHYQLNHLQSVDSNGQRCGLKPCPQVENQETSHFRSNQKVDLGKLCQFTERMKEENPKSESEEISRQKIRQHCSRNISHGTRGKQAQVNSDNELKRPEIPLKRKRSPSPKVFQKANSTKLSVESPANSAANALVGSPGVASSTPSSTGFGQTKGNTQAVMSLGRNHSNIMMQLSRRRTKSLPKTPTSLSSAALPRSATNTSRNSGPTDGSKSMSSTGIKTETPIIALGPRKDLMDRMLGLVSTAQRHGLTTKKFKEEELPEIEKTQPSWQLLSIALADTAVNDSKEAKGQRKMADSFVGGNANAQKSRLIQFQRIEHIFQGPGIPFIAVRHICTKLLMCELAKDAMVEAVVQFGDDRDDESLNSMLHYYLPTMPNAFAADHFAKQFCLLMEKDGFSLVDDQIQAVLSRTNASTNAAATSQPISATGNSTTGPQPTSIRTMFSQQLTNTIGNVSAMSSMQISPSSHTKSPLSLSGNNPNQQLPSNYLDHVNVSLAKPLLFEGSASQLAILQRQHLAQLSGPSYNSEQLQQIQILQQQSLSMNPRKVMLTHRRGNSDNINSANSDAIPFSARMQGGTAPMDGLSRMNNGVGMNGIPASISNISNLVNTDFLTQRQSNSRHGNILMGGQPIHPVSNMNTAALAKAHFMEGKGSTGISTTPSKNQLENLSRPLGMESVQNSNIGRIGEATYSNPQQQLDHKPQLIIKQQHSKPHIHYALQQQLLNSQNQLNTQLNPEQQPSNEQMGSLDLGVVGSISPQLSSHTF